MSLNVSRYVPGSFVSVSRFPSWKSANALSPAVAHVSVAPPSETMAPLRDNVKSAASTTPLPVGPVEGTGREGAGVAGLLSLSKMILAVEYDVTTYAPLVGLKNRPAVLPCAITVAVV